jgi:hypothetical protein
MKIVDIVICLKKDVWRFLAVAGGGNSFGHKFDFKKQFKDVSLLVWFNDSVWP